MKGLRSKIALASAWLLVGCQHQVAIRSVPAGAALYLNDEPIGATPHALTVKWKPSQELILRAEAQGYRPLKVNLQDDLSIRKWVEDVFRFRWRRLKGTTVRTEHELLFIREHGPSGTWSVEEARRN